VGLIEVFLGKNKRYHSSQGVLHQIPIEGIHQKKKKKVLYLFPT